MTKLDTEFFFFSQYSVTHALSLSAELYGMTVTTEATNKKKKYKKQSVRAHKSVRLNVCSNIYTFTTCI